VVSKVEIFWFLDMVFIGFLKKGNNFLI